MGMEETLHSMFSVVWVVERGNRARPPAQVGLAGGRKALHLQPRRRGVRLGVQKQRASLAGLVVAVVRRERVHQRRAAVLVDTQQAGLAQVMQADLVGGALRAFTLMAAMVGGALLESALPGMAAEGVGLAE